MSDKKIYYGVKSLKHNQKRPTQIEALEHLRYAVKYYGKHKIDPELLSQYINKTNEPSLNSIRTNFIKYKAILSKGSKTQIALKHAKNEKEKIKLEKKINNAKEKFNKYSNLLKNRLNK